MIIIVLASPSNATAVINDTLEKNLCEDIPEMNILKKVKIASRKYVGKATPAAFAEQFLNKVICFDCT